MDIHVVVKRYHLRNATLANGLMAAYEKTMLYTKVKRLGVDLGNCN